MIKKLFIQRVLLLAMLLISSKVFAQIPLVTPNSAAYTIVYSSTGQGAGDFITLEVQNDNPCPIRITNIAMHHMGRWQVTFTQPFTVTRLVSTNGAKYDLWTSTTRLTGNPFPVNPANGWTKVATSDTIDTDTLNVVTNIFTGLDTYIPANTTMRLLISCTDTIRVPLNTAPQTVTNSNVTLVNGSGSNIYTGYFGLAAGFNATNFTGISSINFEGAVTVELLPPTTPVADISLKPAIRCLDEMLTLKATHPKPGGTFTWRDKNGTVIAQNTTGTHQLGPLTHAHAGRYYVSYNLCGKESLQDSVTVIISDPPAPTISGKLDYCLNEQFEYTTVNGTNPIWYYTATGGSPVPVTPTINTSTPNTLIYFVSQTDQYGCESRTRTLVRYRAAPKPEKPIVNTPVYYCEEMPAEQLSAIGDTLRWYYFPVNGVPTSTAPTPNTSVNDSFQYYVTQTVDGCESDRSRIDVVVTFRPNGQILIDKTEICAKDSITIGYYGSAFAGSQYNWVVPERGTTILNGFGDNDSTIVIRLDEPGTHKLSLTVGQTGCLSTEYSETITVNPLPYGRIYAKQDVCLGQPELLEVINYTPKLDTFEWDFAGGNTTHFSTEQGPYGVFWSTDGEKIVNVKLVDQGCVSVISDTIMVHPKPNATIVGTQDVYINDKNDPNYRMFVPVDYVEGDEICASDSLKVTVQTVEPGATYKWTPTRFFDTYSDRPVTYARVDFSSKIYVEVEDVYGCQNKDSLEVKTKSCCEMTFPTAFTPNGDGKNDMFRPVTVGRREVRLFQVYNRYGQVIYDSRNAFTGWDGTMNGRDADIGSYFYQINFMCDKENVIQSGEVILVR